MKDETKKPGTALAKAAENAAIPITAETVRKYINEKATPSEITLFLNQCVMFGLNPFKREIYLIKYSDKDPATFVVGYEVYLKRAERTGKWAGMETGTEGAVPDMRAWVKVKRQDWKEPLCHEVFYDEYVQQKDEWIDGKRTGKKVPTRFWAEKPRTMLKKVAIAQALRMAFPDELAGMPQVIEEMHVEDERPVASIELAPPSFTLKPGAPDEFGGDTDPLDEPHHSGEPKAKAPNGAPADLATDEQRALISEQIEEIKRLRGYTDVKMWEFIMEEVQKKGGTVFSDTTDMTKQNATIISGYLHRWAIHIKEAATAKQNGAAKARG
jgi:phage recombination protein Bet